MESDGGSTIGSSTFGAKEETNPKMNQGVEDEIQKKELQEKALDLLCTTYLEVKGIVASLEAYMRKRSSKAVYELRDFLDHLALIQKQEISLADCLHHYEECCTHLRRAIVEPLEYMAERQLLRALRYARYLSLIPYPRSWDPIRSPEFPRDVHKVKLLISSLRENKASMTLKNAASEARYAVEEAGRVWAKITWGHVLSRIGMAEEGNDQIGEDGVVGIHDRPEQLSISFAPDGPGHLLALDDSAVVVLHIDTSCGFTCHGFAAGHLFKAVSCLRETSGIPLPETL